MEKREWAGAAVFSLAAISALIAVIAMFFNFVVSTGTTTFTRTGFNIFRSGSAANIFLLSILIILAVSSIVMGILGVAGMFRSKTYTYVFAALGAGLGVAAFVLFLTATRITWTGFNYQYRRGAGLITMLIFSFLTAAFSLGSLALAKDRNYSVTR